jgi:hypothetical protein
MKVSRFYECLGKEHSYCARMGAAAAGTSLPGARVKFPCSSMVRASCRTMGRACAWR